MDSQRERTYKRPSGFSKWHRHPTLPRNCYLNDIDWIEYDYHEDTLVMLAIFELKLTDGECFSENETQWDILGFFDDIFTCFIWHTQAYKVDTDLWKIDNFWMKEDRNSEKRYYSEDEMKNLLTKMHARENIEKYYRLQNSQNSKPSGNHSLRGNF